MAYMRRWRYCAECKRWLYGKLPPLIDVYCLDCRLDRAKQAAVCMANKSGPYYDQWLNSRGPQGRPRLN